MKIAEIICNQCVAYIRSHSSHICERNEVFKAICPCAARGENIMSWNYWKATVLELDYALAMVCSVNVVHIKQNPTALPVIIIIDIIIHQMFVWIELCQKKQLQN